MRRLVLAILLATSCDPPPRETPDAMREAPTVVRVGGRLDNMWDGFHLELRLNVGGESELLAIETPGVFQFQKELSPASSFTVEIATTPAGHLCTLDSATGTTTTTDVDTVRVDCRVVTNIEVPLPPGITFSPATIQYDVPISVIGDTTTVTVTAPLATKVTIDGIPQVSGVASQPFHLPIGSRVFTIAVTVGDITKTTFLHFDRGARLVRQYAYLKASVPAQDARFGASVAVSRDTIAVGAPGENSSAGAVYIYRRHDLTWSFEARIVESNAASMNAFGTSLSLDGDLLVVGAPGAVSGTGAVYLFRHATGTWSAIGSARPTLADVGDRFGASVSVQGNDFVVGAPGEDSTATSIDGDESNNGSTDSGAAFVYRVDAGDTVTKLAYLKATNTGAGDAFGTSVSLGDGTILIGAPFEDSGIPADESDESGTDSGAAYRFSVSGTTVTVPSNHYIKANASAMGHLGRVVTQCRSSGAILFTRFSFLEMFLDLSHAAFFDYDFPTFNGDFGLGHACVGRLVIAGAPGDDDGSTGIDDFSGTFIVDSGAALVYSQIPYPPGQAPPRDTYIKASNTGVQDHFGAALSADYGTIAVGAPDEDSAAALVDGDQSDNSMSSAGAVYVFH